VTRYGDWRNPSWCNACPDNSYSDATPNFDEGSYMTSCYCNENFRAVAMPIIGMGWCEACPSGMSNAAGDRICYKRDNSCYDGHATTYCDGGVICDENEYVTSSYTCAACPSHSTNPAGDDTAKGPTLCGCDRNYRVSGNACVSCDAGYKNAAGDAVSGSDTSCQEAVPCAEDEYVLDAECTPCPGSSTRAAGDDPAGDDTSCEALLCGENQHVESATCKDCPWNTERPAGDDVDAGNTYCTCPAGYYVTRSGFPSNDNWCYACPDNSYSDATPNFNVWRNPTSCYCNENFRAVATPDASGMGWCEACPSGMSNAAGDRICYKRDPSCYDGHATTYCDDWCASNQRVENNACVPCDAGTTNDAGDVASGEDTLCSATKCGVDEYVSANTCAACAGGSTKPEGDDASGDDTTCACAANERVVSNACVACDAGETNAAGNPVPGPDTCVHQSGDSSSPSTTPYRCSFAAAALIE
jgi:hypothetical protein